MNEHPPSRLELLRFLQRVQEQHLGQTRRWIEREEQRAAEIAGRRPRPAPPDWVIEYAISGVRTPIYVHTGDCRLPGGRKKALTREQALRALTVEHVPPCSVCHPDQDLGVLD
jgi:hypothetical protein